MDFLTFAPDYWHGPRHNRHYFCEELSKTNRVLFVSPPFYIVDIIRGAGKRGLPSSGDEMINENLVAHIPSKLHFTNYRFPGLSKLLKRLRVRRIKRLMKKMGIESPVLLIWHPRFLDMLDFFPDSLVVYYVYDNLTGYIGGDNSKRYEAEDELLRRADVTLVLSQELLKKHAEFSENVHLLPNAVDYDLFSTSRSDLTKIPEELSRVPGPRIGYIGTINEKVDLEILELISDARPDWSIVLVGRDNYQRLEERRRFHRFLERDNVYRFGYREYATIPSYVKGLDVCMMCYVVNEWTFYGDPSKMHEYLASGKPTIATALPAIKEFNDVIDIPEKREDWVSAIESRLNEQSGELRAKRIDVAKQNSYQARVRRTLELLSETRHRNV